MFKRRSGYNSEYYADNQYRGKNIEKLVSPILNEKADIVVGERPIKDIKHLSPLKKRLQHFGS